MAARLDWPRIIVFAPNRDPRARSGQSDCKRRGLKVRVGLRNPIAAMSAVALAACGACPVGPAVPPSLAVPSEQKLLLKADASGVQIYECRADKADPAKFGWAFVAPEAVLTDSHGAKIGKHYAGPTWESNDGSSVTASVAARADAPAPGAIPWLLLSAKSTAGSGVLTGTKSVQRIQTAGGNPPAEGCDASHAGATARTPYTAVYRFYGTKSP